MSTITVDKSPPRTPPPVSSVDATPPRTDAPPALQLCNASRGYGSGGSRVEVLRNLNLSVRKGEFVAVVGFSGSGKTTLMQLMAGLLGPDSGETLMNGEPYNQPESRRGLVFQNYSLLPWLTVYGNIELAVRQVFKHWDRATRDAHIRKFIDMVSLTPAMRKRPGELSGGMRQRVSLARTLALQPEVLLLDEPLSALDAITRGVLQDEILKIWETEKQTCVMITNSVDEALLMADRVVPLNPPGAEENLGTQFVVDLPRPRVASQLNKSSTFRRLRKDITEYLIDMRDRTRQMAEEKSPVESIVLPDLDPKTRHLSPVTTAVFPNFRAPGSG